VTELDLAKTAAKKANNARYLHKTTLHGGEEGYQMRE